MEAPFAASPSLVRRTLSAAPPFLEDLSLRKSCEHNRTAYPSKSIACLECLDWVLKSVAIVYCAQTVRLTSMNRAWRHICAACFFLAEATEFRSFMLGF